LLALQACTRNARALEQLDFVSLEVQGSTEEFEKISEEEDGCFLPLRAGIMSFIKRVFHRQKIIGQKTQFLNREHNP